MDLLACLPQCKDQLFDYLSPKEEPLLVANDFDYAAFKCHFNYPYGSKFYRNLIYLYYKIKRI